MPKNYNETKQILKALKNLDAESKFVSFKDIFHEFIKVRGSKIENLAERTIDNLISRTRRVLVLDNDTLKLKENTKNIKKGSQSKELSIAIKYPDLKVISKTPIHIKKNGNINDSKEVEENYFKLIKVKTKSIKNKVVFANEIENDNNEQLFIEGKVKKVLVNNYERDLKAREKCIEYHGTTCKVCDFDFERKYGEIGRGYIHVHHKKEISSIKKEYEVDPINDLVPVCPNCHSMLHKKSPSYSIEELKAIINQKLI